MKARFSEEYYREFWDEFLKKVPGEDYINLEAELANAMKVYAGLPETALAIICKMEAGKIAEHCMELVKKQMRRIADIDAGRASFGCTTQRQEIQLRGEFRKRFEFNCLQLKDFKAKYGL